MNEKSLTIQNLKAPINESKIGHQTDNIIRMHPDIALTGRRVIVIPQHGQDRVERGLRVIRRRWMMRALDGRWMQMARPLRLDHHRVKVRQLATVRHGRVVCKMKL